MKLKAITKEDIDKIIEKTKKDMEKLEKKKKAVPTPRVGKCKICGGKVTESFFRRYIPETGPIIIGPGSKNQFTWSSTGLGCEDCGIAYRKLPNEK